MIKKLSLLIVFLLSFSTPVLAEEIEENTVQPKSSYVFSHVSSTISKSAYGGDCSLMDVGKGTITIILQKKLTSNNSWMPVDDAEYSKSFSNTTVCSYSKSKVLSSGTYRCKTYVTATVGSYSDTRTVYSPELTIN